MGKGCLIGCGVVAALGVMVLICAGIAGFIAFGATAPVAAAADAFLEQLGQGQVAEAYQSAAQGLRERQDEAAFAAQVEELGLTEYESSWWSNRNIENNKGYVAGTITTRSGGDLPLEIDLVYEDETWKVLSFAASTAGPEGEAPLFLPEPSDERPQPSDDEVAELVRDTLVSLNKAVLADDFTSFHADVARLWQNEASPEELAEIFAEFTAQGIDITGVAEAEPVLNAPPTIDDDGFLHARGYSLIDERQVDFDLTYAYEHPAWKLVGIEVAVNRPESSEPDSDDAQPAVEPQPEDKTETEVEIEETDTDSDEEPAEQPAIELPE